MARNFSDVFRSDDRESRDERDSEFNSDTIIDQNVDSDTDASNSGISLETESFRQDEDGEVSYDRTALDTGDTDLGNSLNVDSLVDNILGGSSSSSSSDSVDSN